MGTKSGRGGRANAPRGCEEGVRLFLGAHVSIAGGLHLAFERGQRLGCDVLQIFQRPNLRWSARRLGCDEVEAFVRARGYAGVEPVLAHACYLINLASGRGPVRRRSREVLADEMRRAGRLGVLGVILHPGSGSPRRRAIERIAAGINYALSAAGGEETLIILENTAGSGEQVGDRFEDLAAIIERLEQPRRAAICIDTCHLFAAGYDIRTPETYRRTWETFGEVLGFSRLRVLHLNDSVFPLGSRRDRHFHIGRGAMGTEAFRLLMTDDRLRQVPKIIETPKREGGRPMDAANLNFLRRLAGAGTVGPRGRGVRVSADGGEAGQAAEPLP